MNSSPPQLIPLDEGVVHLWTISLHIETGEQADLRSLLSPDEQQRADRFLVEDARRRFIACRSRLRLLLGHYLDVDPHDVIFAYSGLGKPAVPSHAVHFNVTHSHELAAIAFSRIGELGTDLEHLPRRINDLSGLAERFFSAYECERLFAVDEEHRQRDFLRLWTCKEAILKATGKGLTFPLNKVTIDVAGDESRLLFFGDQDQNSHEWSLQQLPLGGEYMAALAAPFPLPKPNLFQW